MYETADEVTELQRLIDASHTGGTSHLREIISGDRLMAAHTSAVSNSMCFATAPRPSAAERTSVPSRESAGGG